MVRAEAVNDDPRFLDTMAGAVMQTWHRYRSGIPVSLRLCRHQLAWKARRRFDRRLRLGSPLTLITGAASSPVRCPRDAYGRTPINIVRSAFEFCVRTVSHTPLKPW